MPKKILLIENDSSFAADVSRALEERGCDVRVTGDGRAGLDLAREWAPSAVVLCVELPGMSGYLVCQKLRKEDALRSIPLVLTSAEATEETFEKHRTLKARADEYLLKPYAPEILLATLDALVGLPGAAEDEEEIVSLEEEMGLEAMAVEPEAELAALDLEALPGSAPALEDDDLALLDHAFDEISMPAPDLAGDALDLALGGEAAPAAEPPLLELEEERGASEPARLLDPTGDAATEAGGAVEASAIVAEADLAAALDEAGRAAERARAAEDEVAALRERLAETEARAGDAESRVEEARAEARRARAEAAGAATKLAELDRALEGLRTDLVVARGEAEGARGEVEKRTGELRRRVAELEAANAKHEERVLKAYQRLKGDERVKDKVRKALAIAAQLLEEGAAPAEPGVEKERRAPTTATRG
jgi:CheY-like chemotaxis protein